MNSLNGESDDLEKYKPDHDIYNETFSERGDDFMEVYEPMYKSPTPSSKSNSTVSSQHSAEQSLTSNVAQNNIAEAPFSVSKSE
jgi:hypothetical protein